jgi:hypothetical protein
MVKFGPLQVSWGHKTMSPEKYTDDHLGEQRQHPQARDVLDGCELAMVAYKIDNGYLLRIGNSMHLAPALIYCTDEQDMATKIVAHRAKQKIMGKPDGRYGVGAQAVTLSQI